ncbi:MAG: hypothetical protein FJY92_09975 [Candidatus Hydrogenedentes bacterium]|nr:hypothetical protein [Candidatus Hydrogenedentota bacterium]
MNCNAIEWTTARLDHDQNASRPQDGAVGCMTPTARTSPKAAIVAIAAGNLTVAVLAAVAARLVDTGVSSVDLWTMATMDFAICGMYVFVAVHRARPLRELALANTPIAVRVMRDLNGIHSDVLKLKIIIALIAGFFAPMLAAYALRVHEVGRAHAGDTLASALFVVLGLGAIAVSATVWCRGRLARYRARARWRACRSSTLLSG